MAESKREPPVVEVESVDSKYVGTDLFGIRDLELGSEDSDWPKLLDSGDAKDGRELLQGATSGSGVPKLSPDPDGERRGDGGQAEQVSTRCGTEHKFENHSSRPIWWTQEPWCKWRP